MVVVITALKQFRSGGALILVVNRQENFGKYYQAGNRRQFPPGQQGHLVAVHADQLVGTEVGQRYGTGHKNPRQPATGQEHFLILTGYRVIIRARSRTAFDVSQVTNQCSDNNEDGDLNRLHWHRALPVYRFVYSFSLLHDEVMIAVDQPSACQVTPAAGIDSPSKSTGCPL